MKNKQIVFIICINDMQHYSECVKYIQELNIPEGYKIDIISIQKADSITAAYNAGMESGTAKYKIYLEEDTFIINPDFLEEVLRIFHQDVHIGLIGMLGAIHINKYGEPEWLSGKELKKEKSFEDYTDVLVVHGSIMVTQYDVFWREDLISGQNFYDISQSMEMHRAGYRVVVPHQSERWMIHDKKSINNEGYELDRKKVMQEYNEIFTEKMCNLSTETIVEREELRKTVSKLKEFLNYILAFDKDEQVQKIIVEIKELNPNDTIIQIFIRIVEIKFAEKYLKEKCDNFILEGNEWQEQIWRYTWVKYVLRRIEFGRKDERISELKQLLQQKKLSIDAMRIISYDALNTFNVVYEKLYEDLKREEQPLVSVVVPVYNGEDTLEDSINSILEQSYQNMELILVDDASTDKSKEIIFSYKKKDTRIKSIFLEENHHVCYTANLAFRMANGKYIALSAHDDIWKRDKLMKQVSFLEQHPNIGLCFSWVDIIDENRNIINKKFFSLYQRFSSWNYDQATWMKKLLCNGNFFCSPSLCVKSEILNTIGYYRYGLVQLQDYDWYFRAFIRYPVYILCEKLVEYRRFLKDNKNISSITEKKIVRNSHETAYIIEHFIKGLSKDDLLSIFGEELCNTELSTEKQLLCEKAMLLLKYDAISGIYLLIDLFEDEECHKILVEKYHLTLKDFYEWNTKEFLA